MSRLGLSSRDFTIVVIILSGFFSAMLYILYRQLLYYVNLRKKLQRIYSEEDDTLKGMGKMVKSPYHTIAGNMVKELGSEYPITDYYDFQDHLLGRGSSAEVVIGTSKRYQRRYAVKLVDMRKASAAWRYDREQSMLKDLDHVNIVRLFEVYRKDRTLYFVMELCSGGHLGHALLEAGGKFPESTAKMYITQLTRALMHCHMRGICHRDVKLQNVLVESNAPDAQIKLIDFGNAARFPGKLPLTKIVGTTYTVAPEVFKQCYDERCDVWSLGVVAYILLSGHRPFDSQESKHKTNKRARESAVITNILLGRYHFLHESWGSVSEEAIFFVKSCLEMEYQYRRSAERCLQLSWFEKSSPEPLAVSSARSGEAAGLYTGLQNENIANKLISRLRKHIASSKLRRVAMVGVAFIMPSKKVLQLRHVFQQIDDGGVGYISKERFKVLATSLSKYINVNDCNDMFDAMDVNMSETVTFNEFVAATIDPREVDIKVINNVFRIIDVKEKGYIDQEDLIRLLETTTDQSTRRRRSRLVTTTSISREVEDRRAAIAEIAEEAILEVDMDEDGVISYAEFLYAIADSSSLSVASAGKSRDELVRSAAERSLSRSSVGPSTATVPEAGMEVTSLRHSHTTSSDRSIQADSLSSRLRRGTESSLHLSLANFSMRRSSILSRRAPDTENSAASNTGVNAEDRKGSIVLPSMLTRGNSTGGKSLRRFSLLGGQGPLTDCEVGSSEALDTTQGVNRRNSMLNDPQVPSIMQLFAEDVSLATRSLIGRVTGDGHALGLLPTPSNTQGLANTSGIEDDNLSDEDGGDWVGDDWADGEEGAQRVSGVKVNSDRRMSSPAMIWNNLRRRSSVLRSISDLSLPLTLPSTKSQSNSGSATLPVMGEGSKLEQVDTAGSIKRERRLSDNSKRRKAQQEVQGEQQQRQQEKQQQPSHTQHELNAPKSGEGSVRQYSQKGTIGAPISSRSNSPAHLDRLASTTDSKGQKNVEEHVSRVLDVALDEDEDGGVYVLDEGPLLLHEVVAAASLNSPLSSVYERGDGSGQTPPGSPLTLPDEREWELRLSNKSDDASVRGVIETLHDGRTVQRLEFRDTETKLLSRDAKGLLKIDTEPHSGGETDIVFSPSQTNSRASKSSAGRHRPLSVSSLNLDKTARQQGKSRGNLNSRESMEADGAQCLSTAGVKSNDGNDDISADSNDNSRSDDKSYSPGPSREITRDWDLDGSTLSDASEKLQTLVNYLKQKEAKIGKSAGSEPMTPEMAQELSDKLAGPSSLLSDMSRGRVGDEISAEGSMATIHEGTSDFKGGNRSKEMHVTKLVHDTFVSAFNAGFKMGRSEGTQKNNDLEGEERELDQELQADTSTKPSLTRRISK